jgi:cytochrome c556
MTKTLLAAALAATVAATAAWAATPAETITARQTNFKQIGRASKGIADELKKPEADMVVIRTNAGTIVGLAGNIHRWFPRGSGAESGEKTGALPVIWQQGGQFNRAAGQLVTAARNLQRAAASGNLDQVKAAYPAMGAACKGCHDTFKGSK